MGVCTYVHRMCVGKNVVRGMYRCVCVLDSLHWKLSTVSMLLCSGSLLAADLLMVCAPVAVGFGGCKR